MIHIAAPPRIGNDVDCDSIPNEGILQNFRRGAPRCGRAPATDVKSDTADFGLPPAISVVVPVRDEAENIEPLLAEIQSALDGLETYEILCVDDGSRDATPQILAAAMTACPALRVIRHSEPSGQSAALITGIRGARAPWIVTLDGDGQNDPADIPALLKVLHDPQQSEAPQLICGQRRRRQDTWTKRVSSRIANTVRRMALRDGTPDTGCGLKLFSRETFLSLPQFDHMHRFLPSLVQTAGGRVVSVEVSHRPRRRGKTHYGIFDRLWVSIVDLGGVMWLERRMKRPLAVELSAPAPDARAVPPRSMRLDG
jgi:dolichol-phosphate mannosyltransferase